MLIRLFGVLTVAALALAGCGSGSAKVDDRCRGAEDADGDGLCEDDPCPSDPDNDADDDGLCADQDPCRLDPANDEDGDGACADVDVCPTDPDNDADGDGSCADADPCPLDPDDDDDGDGACGDVDPCPLDPDDDDDGDGQCADVDPCPFDPDDDLDGDGVCGDIDTCPLDPDNDADADGICGDVDDCPLDPDNDADGDGLCADVDNCPDLANGSQLDTDADGLGNICDPCPTDVSNDADSDGVCGAVDNCPADANPLQVDGDLDGLGDACDACAQDADNDLDGDGVCGNDDTCPSVSDPGQADADQDGYGDVCDNCPADDNPAQTDGDADGAGDACDPCPADVDDDIDADGVCGDVDNCPLTQNGNQLDSDADGNGDVCDPCPRDYEDDADQDGVCGDIDNCPATANPGQLDSDTDGLGDACDPCPTDPLCGEDCGDGVDNDLDGMLDCADPDCATDAFCVAIQDQLHVCASGGAPFTQIRDAVAAAADGDTIGACAGTYEWFEVDGRQLTIIGYDGAAVTTVDGGIRQAVHIYNGATVELSAFTVRGTGSQYVPPALQVEGSSVFVHDMVFSGNNRFTSALSGMVQQKDSDGMWQDIVFEDNDVPARVFVALGTGSVRVHRAIFRNNAPHPTTTGPYAAANMIIRGPDSEITNSLFYANTVSGGQDISLEGFTNFSRFYNNTLYDNSTSTVLLADSGVDVQNNIVQLASGTGICAPSGEYNLSFSTGTNFCSGPGPTDYQLDAMLADPAGGDFALLPGSPAIDAGNPSSSFDDEDGTRNDLGASGGPWVSSDLAPSAIWIPMPLDFANYPPP